jgi:hypothetical protein
MKKSLQWVVLFFAVSAEASFWGHLYAENETLAPAEVKNVTQTATQEPDKKNQPVNREEVLDLPANTGPMRRFHEVLDELLIEFGYDLKMGQVNGIKNLAIRKTEVNEVLPNSYRKYVRMLVNERIQMNTDIHLLSCILCENKYSKIIDGKLIVTSPTTNAALLRSTSEQLGIEYFMDVMLVYHPTHMVLAFEIFKSSTNELVWSRAYNSETIRSRYQRLAIDYKQVEKSRKSDEYVPEYRIMIGAGGVTLPNIGGSSADSSLLGLEFRSMERFNKRRSEFGLSLTALRTSDAMSGAASTTPSEPVDPSVPKPFQSALMLHVLFAHNFLGSVESYDEVRQGLHIGGGALLAGGGYFAGMGRVGWDFFFGRRWALGISGLYVMPSEVVVNGDTVKTKGGVGGEGIVSFNF